MMKECERMIQENRAFKEMLKVAKEWLSGKDPVEIEKKTGIFYNREGSCFKINLHKSCSCYPLYFQSDPYIMGRSEI